MEKKQKRIAFWVCIGIGLFSGVVLFMALGYELGFTWYLALCCFGGGIVVWIAVYFLYFLNKKWENISPLDNSTAQKKLLAYERENVGNFEEKYCAYSEKGKGLKHCMCETCLYIQAEKILITVWYFWKIYTMEIPYEEISLAIIYNDKMLNFELLHDTDRVIEIILKESAPELKKVLRKKGVYVYLENSNAAQGNGTYDEEL